MSNNAVQEIRIALNAIAKEIEQDGAQTQLAALEALLAQSSVILKLARAGLSDSAEQKPIKQKTPKHKKARKLKKVTPPSASGATATGFGVIPDNNKQVPRL